MTDQEAALRLYELLKDTGAWEWEETCCGETGLYRIAPWSGDGHYCKERTNPARRSWRTVHLCYLPSEVHDRLVSLALKWLLDGGIYWDFGPDSDGEGTTWWAVTLHSGDGKSRTFNGDTATQAVLAACKAVMGEGEK